MITGELKNRIDSIWEIFWTGGLTNPLDVIEQMTYLMFIHDLDTTDTLRAKESTMLGLPFESIFAEEVQIGNQTVDGTQLKWSVFHDFPAAKMYSVMQEWVFPFIKNLHGNKESAYSRYMGDAIFKVPMPLMLDKIVTAMDDMYEQMAKLSDTDARGDVYEYLLSKLSTAGVNGQFRTPRHIIRMMVELMQPKPDDLICEKTLPTLIQTNETYESTQIDAFFESKPKIDAFLKIDANAQSRNTKWHPDQRLWKQDAIFICFFIQSGDTPAMQYIPADTSLVFLRFPWHRIDDGRKYQLLPGGRSIVARDHGVSRAQSDASARGQSFHKQNNS